MHVEGDSMDQDYEIVLSPDLEISPADFVAAWNETAETHDFAEARLSKSAGVRFDLPLIVTIIISVTGGAASNVISDLIMKTLDKRGVRKHTHIERVKKADGTESFVADIDEE